LNLIFTQETREQWFIRHLVFEVLSSVSINVIFEGQEVKHLVEHCETVVFIGLFGIGFKRFETFPELVDFTENGTQLMLETFLKQFEGYLMSDFYF
jgi:hypothetical protein